MNLTKFGNYVPSNLLHLLNVWLKDGKSGSLTSFEVRDILDWN